jgi:hypothetical protein
MLVSVHCEISEIRFAGRMLTATLFRPIGVMYEYHEVWCSFPNSHGSAVEVKQLLAIKDHCERC